MLLSLMVSAVLVGPLCVENFQVVGLTPAVAHLICAHMVPLVLGCRGHGSVLLPLWLHFQLRIEMASYNCAGETQLCPAVLLLLFLDVYVVTAVMILGPIYVPSVFTPCG